MTTNASSLLLQGRRILVTGAARGLGFAFAQTLCSQGAQVVLADLRAELLDASVQCLRDQGHAAHGVCVDVSDPAAVQACADQAVQLLGGLDGLVNNAAVT
ncbi:MAG: SDR family NAD(P)-dependent oxidoreductase, partial [Comamonas sp.]